MITLHIIVGCEARFQTLFTNRAGSIRADTVREKELFIMKIEDFMKRQEDPESGHASELDNVRETVWAMLETRVKFLLPTDSANGKTSSELIAYALGISPDLDENFTFLDWATGYRSNAESWKPLVDLAPVIEKIFKKTDKISLYTGSGFDCADIPGDDSEPVEKRRERQQNFYKYLMSEMEIFSDPLTALGKFCKIKCKSYFDYLVSETVPSIPRFDRSGEEKLKKIALVHLKDAEKFDIENDLGIGMMILIADYYRQQFLRKVIDLEELDEILTTIFTELLMRPFEYLGEIWQLS